MFDAPPPPPDPPPDPRPPDGPLLSEDEALQSLNEWCGLLNAAHGQVVRLLIHALAKGWCDGAGIHSPAHWVAWKTGCSPNHARGLVRLAERAEELPETLAALEAGLLSLDQAAEIARLAPPQFEASVVEFAQLATFSQLRRTLRAYGWPDPPKPDPEPEPEPERDPEPEPEPRPSWVPPPPAIEEEREVAMGFDEQGWWLRARFPADEGAQIDRVLRALRDQRYVELAEDRTAEEPARRVTLADGLLAAAQAAAAHGQEAHPATDRYRVYLHLSADRGAKPGTLGLHHGPALPDHLRRLLLCDADLIPVVERNGSPTHLGRTARTVPAHLRRLLEHRDGGCTVPGCTRRTGLQIHHIVHWEDGGTTDPGNCVTLCATHHRQHHLERFFIRGSADLPIDHPGALTFLDRWQQPMAPGATPLGPASGRVVEQLDGRLPPDRPPYQHPLGERLDSSAVTFVPKDTPP